MIDQIITSHKLTEFKVVNGTSTKSFGNMSITRDLDDSARDNRGKFFNRLGIDHRSSVVLFPNLRHSANIALVSRSRRNGCVDLTQRSPEIMRIKKMPGINPPKDYILHPESGIDACISKSDSLFIAMALADCAPVMFYDLITGCYALVHAGVLGAFSGIVKNTIKCMEDWCDAKPPNLICYIGPCITSRAYNLKKSGLWNVVLSNVVKKDVAENFDLKTFLSEEVKMAGLKKNNIEISPFCTATSEDMFFSNYRVASKAAKIKQGRHISIIGRQ